MGDSVAVNLEMLKRVRWQTACLTYGNAHATLIGLVVDWWITQSPTKRRVLESGPTWGYHEKGVGSTHCDAVLLEEDEPVGILEVEGTRPDFALSKFGDFFGERDFASTTFGLMVV